MNLILDLYNNYNLFEEAGYVDEADEIEEKTVLLPIYHWNMKANGKNIIEIELNKNSEFLSGEFLENDRYIIFPVTEDSLTRTSGISPHPICDDISYLIEDKQSNKRDKYLEELSKWCEFIRKDDEKDESKVPEIVYSYIKKGTILTDLKDLNISKKGVFITFSIEGEKNISITKSQKFHELYIEYYKSILEKKEDKKNCVISGKKVYCGTKFKGFQGSGSKLISISNNKEVYVGRFNKDEPGIINLGYEAVTKAMNMLKYYTDNKKTSKIIAGNSYLINWFSENVEDIEDITDLILFPNTTNENLGKMIVGVQKRNIRGEFLILIIDKVSPGRAAIKYFRKLQSSDLFDVVKKWYEDTKWEAYFFKEKEYRDTITPLYRYPEYIYGIEDKDKKYLICHNNNFKASLIERLIPCVVEGKKIPLDVVHKVNSNLAKRISYSNLTWNKIVNFSCGILKKYSLDYKKGDLNLMFNLENNDRNYLYGRLLAVYDKLEKDTFSEDEKKKRQTNVVRYWNKFINKPASTLGILRTKLIPYFNKNEYSGYYQTLISEIMEKFNAEDKELDKKLNYLFIFGYDQQYKEFFKSKKENN